MIPGDLGEHIDIHAAWRAVTFTAHKPSWGGHAAVEELRRVYDEAVVAEFSVDDPAHWAAYRQSMWRRQWDFTALLLDSAAFTRAAPALAAPRTGDPDFERLFAFDLAGSFARALHSGGAYRQTKTVARAEELGRSLVQALIGDRRVAVDVLLAEHAWHGWFRDIAWDRTWVVLDWDAGRIAFLAVTATD